MSQLGGDGDGQASSQTDGQAGSQGSPDGRGSSGQRAMVNDFTAQRFALDAISAGVPKREVRKWVLDLSRDFYVVDDRSFERAWCELRDRWERNSRRQQRRQKREDFNSRGRVPLEAGAASSSEPATAARKRPREWSRAEGAACATAAREDVISCSCSYEQALAVRLVLAFGTGAVAAMAELQPSFGREALPLKGLARLVHPDKCPHPRAKEAFQRLAPALQNLR
uniref:J domain-containing protein n=1 Tax=Alexandrium monilatum TaxID=311494 RepID=A0A7S4V8C7_9DINO